MDDAPEQEQPQQDNRGSWFVVQTLTMNENKVRDSIQRQIRLGDQVPVYEAFVPTEKVSEFRYDKNGKPRKVETTRKIYPGYVFVRMDLYDGKKIDERVWYFIRNIQGVLGFPGGDNPLPLSESEAADLKRILEPAAVPREKCVYEVGDHVQIKEEVFAGYEGQVLEVDRDRGRLVVGVSVFGRSTPVELGFWQVERLS